MQLALVESGRQVAPRTATQAAAATRMAAPARIAEHPHKPAILSSAVPVRGGLKGVDPLFNGRVAGAQQALAFLERADGQLQGLKAELSSRLSQAQRHGNFAGEVADTAVVEKQIRRFDALWRERPTAAAGTLDNQLGYQASGQARQQFSVRGLQMSSLRTGDRETLSFSVGGRAQRAASVTIEPGLPDAVLVQRFDRALAPSGIRATRDAQGEIRFSVPESAWPALRDALAVKGEGKRFPTGQFSQVRLVPEEPAIRPQDWSAKDTTTTRRTLQQVLIAQASVRDVRQEISTALTDAGHRLQPQTPAGEAKTRADAHWSVEFTRTFDATAGRGDYQALSAITAALVGISRERVTALLDTAAG